MQAPHLLPAGYEIAQPRPHELAALGDVEVRAAALLPLEDLPLEMREEGLPLAFFEEAAREGRLWVARTLEGATPVGFVALTFVDATPHVHEIDVLPEHARRGLGRALLEHAIGWARADGFGAVTLTTFRHIAWNAPFYASLGFAEIAPHEIGSELAETLASEARRGLDPTQRIAMRLDLDDEAA